MKKSVFKNIFSQKGLVDILALMGIAIMLITLPAANKLLSERQEIRKQAQSTVCPIGCCGGECGTCPSGQSCDIQNGACSSGLSCNPQGYGTHLACRDNQCVWEPGDGAPECSTNEECEQEQQEVCKANECCGTGVKCNSAGTACNVADLNCGAKQKCWPGNCCAEGYKCRDDGTACDVSENLCKSTPPPPTPTITPKATPTITPTPSLTLNCSGDAPNGGVFRCDNPSDTHFGTYKCYQRPDKPKPACYYEYEKIDDRSPACKGQICVRYKGWFCDDSNRPKGACDCCDAFATSTPTPLPTSTPTVTPTPLPGECKGKGLHCVPKSEINLGVHTCYVKAGNKGLPACYLEKQILSDKDCGDKSCTSYEGWWCLDDKKKLAGDLPNECKGCCSAYVETEPTATPTLTPTPLPTSTPKPTPTPIVVSCNGKSFAYIGGTCWACANDRPNTNFDNQKFLCDAESANICSGKKVGDAVPYSGRCFTCFDNGYGMHVNIDTTMEACNPPTSTPVPTSTPKPSDQCDSKQEYQCVDGKMEECLAGQWDKTDYNCQNVANCPLDTQDCRNGKLSYCINGNFWAFSDIDCQETKCSTGSRRCIDSLVQICTKRDNGSTYWEGYGEQYACRKVDFCIPHTTLCISGKLQTCNGNGERFWWLNDTPCGQSSTNNSSSSLSGQISGSIISNAIITAIDLNDKKYTVKADKNGNFNLDVPTNQKYKVTIEALGYKPFTFAWDPSDGKDYFSQIKLEKIRSDKQGSFALEEKIEKQHLLSGWSLISLSVNPNNPLTASSLAREINDQSGEITSISRWVNSSWETFITGLDKNDFPIEVGKAYFIENGKETDFALQGEEITQPQTLDLNIGWNTVSFPKTVNCQTDSCYAQLLLNLIDVTKFNSAKTITEYNSGLWDTLSKENDKYYGNNFLIKSGIGYFLKITQPLKLLP